MEIFEFILDNRIILIPVLIIIGWFIKNTRIIPDKYIPLILLLVSILLSLWVEMGITVQAVIQGILVAGAAVLGHQIQKQLQKDE